MTETKALPVWAEIICPGPFDGLRFRLEYPIPKVSDTIQLPYFWPPGTAAVRFKLDRIDGDTAIYK